MQSLAIVFNQCLFTVTGARVLLLCKDVECREGRLVSHFLGRHFHGRFRGDHSFFTLYLCLLWRTCLFLGAQKTLQMLIKIYVAPLICEATCWTLWEMSSRVYIQTDKPEIVRASLLFPDQEEIKSSSKEMAISLPLRTLSSSQPLYKWRKKQW